MIPGITSKNITSYKNTNCIHSADSFKTKSSFETKSDIYKQISVSSSTSSQSKTSTLLSTQKIGDLRTNLRQTKFLNANVKLLVMEEGASITLSTECNSKGSFLSCNSKLVEEKENLPEFIDPLRLFSKSGKPLTDQKGRPLANIFGEKLVIFDDEGKVVSDLRGNQVFNCLGESAIYPSTNLNIPPSDNEPDIPLLDIGRGNILFLYDNTGHPLTDCFGRPLLYASGKPMIGMRAKDKVDISNHEGHSLKKIYSRKPLENLIRHVQIFNSTGKPLTDGCGRLLEDASIICNKNGMPMCTSNSQPLYFKYGNKIALAKRKNINMDNIEENVKLESEFLQLSDSRADLTSMAIEKSFDGIGKDKDEQKVGKVKFADGFMSDRFVKYSNENDILGSVDFENPDLSNDSKTTLLSTVENNVDKNLENKNETIHITDTPKTENMADILEKQENQSKPLLRETSGSQKFTTEQNVIVLPPDASENLPENKTEDKLDHKTNLKKESTNTVFLFNATEKIKNTSSVHVAHFEAIKEEQSRFKSKSPKKMYSLNLFQFFKDSLSKTSEKQCMEPYQYNEYGKPLKDIHGNFLYDRHGIPLTGAHGRRLGDKARQTLRSKLRNVPKKKVNIPSRDKFLSLSHNESHDEFGEPVYDKYGRPLYDLAGMLIYDKFGRPLTDAYGRSLVDAIGQPLMDCEGRVLTSADESYSNTKLVDIFGRKIYDRRGRMLFDSFGRPKYDIFTNAIYDNCGRPTTDANGRILFDFLNKPIQPFSEKPLYKNVRSHLPKHIDTILAVPSVYRLLKYSQPLKDAFGGPLFDDLGRPLYNKIGMPLFDRYGRPLYKSDGTPLCDCYGRPLSEDVRESDDDQTLSVVDCLKLLKVTDESSKWMFSKNKGFKPEQSEVSNVVEVCCKRRCGQYVYTLTRVTRFASGRQALEILEAPLSQATVAEMHQLPVDNKPLVLMVGQKHKTTVKQ
ncbi:uncharacterized protein LOC128999676 [Macrosteles quadrilineatus]|uniref:uncharacterized protein LOC128999676 n=1 Tax=Macrosteles quadrilineatus TaxID=74068 RepID=UPI0023E2037C|nr:uncharacterized protein LOC128999676 [Macrosteles quadrilineatus]